MAIRDERKRQQFHTRGRAQILLSDWSLARKRRIFIPDVSSHIIHRGNNRGSIVRDDNDREVFLMFLRRASERYRLRVHGYALMDTHYHLVATPSNPGCTASTMKELGERYVAYFNYRHKRIGTLWNGRYRDLPILDERYWLTCLRYVELNPVRAHMVKSPEAFRWSSYAVHAHGTANDWLTPHWLYLALGSTPEERRLAYRSLCEVAVTRAEMLEQRLTWSPTRRTVDGDERSKSERMVTEGLIRD
jgi:putative transposase